MRRLGLVTAGVAVAGLIAGAAGAQAPGAPPPPAPAAAASAPAAPARGDLAAVDYRQPAAWLCRPGVDDGTCSTNLDAMAIDAAGARTRVAYVAAKDPPIDCFYVYPTVSNDPTLYSDMVPGAEERRTTHGQAARLGAACRLFVPVYHQFTATGLGYAMSHADVKLDFDPPYRDVLAAWRDYLARDNHGRGVVLIGHSQGAILLKRLIAEEIDGKPAQKRLVAAYLAGNLDLTNASFKAIKPCAASAQTGCVVAWSSYLEGTEGPRVFGGKGDAAAALCVDPAAPGGGRGAVKAYLPRPAMAPESDPPYIEVVGQMTAECVSDAAGTVLRYRIEPGRYSDLLQAALARRGLPGWGLHPLDISLVQGNILDMIGAQSAAWGKR